MTTETKSKELIRPIPATWWLQRPAYLRFMIREVASIFIAGYCLFLMVVLYRAAQSQGAFRALFESLRSPLSVILHLIALGFAVFHSVTFFNATPRILVVFRGEEKVPERVIAGAHYVLWAVVSLVLILLAVWA